MFLRITDVAHIKLMTHEDLLEIGFKLYGVEENDPFYRITFRSPFIGEDSIKIEVKKV